MIPISFALIEWVRRLEEQQHVFASDPQRITLLLKDETGSFTQKLCWRAERIDSDHQLKTMLTQINARAALLFHGLVVAWLLLGIFAAVGLMQTPALNFFYLLLSVLGANAVMFGLWLCWLLKPPTHMPAMLNHILPYLVGRKPSQQALLRVYKEQLNRASMKWFWGKISHQLWLASLSGLFIGVVLMLLVRQYTFTWQSTLLDQSSLSTVVMLLAWLPQTLGLNLPDAHTVAQSQSMGSVEFSRQWANLLWSALLIYGIVPRCLAWWLCRERSRRIAPTLPLNKPYYQRLQRLWQNQIVDQADNYRPDATRRHQPAPTSTARLLSASWEVAAPETVVQNHHATDAIDVGLIDSRDEQAALLAQLTQQACRLLLFVRLQSLPDRGNMRRLGQLADHAQGGMVVCLWGDDVEAHRLRLWQHALDHQAIAWQWKEPNI